MLNLLKSFGNSTRRDILVMFSELDISFRITATKDVLNVIIVVANDLQKGIYSLQTKVSYIIKTLYTRVPKNIMQN